MIFCFIIISLRALQSVSLEDNCLLSEKLLENSMCLFCKAGFYNVDSDGSELFPKEKCVPKKNNSVNSSKIILIAPRTLDPFRFSQLKQKYTLYENFLEALFYEDQLAKSQTSDLGPGLYFKFLRGEHYLLPKDLINGVHSFFIRNKVAIIITPLYCREAPNEAEGICYQNGETVIIYLKLKKLLIFISYKLWIANVIIDGVDMIIAEQNQPCQNEQKICCKINECIPKEKITYLSDSTNYYGIFNLEPLIEEPIPTTPEIKLENVCFKNLNLISSDIPTNGKFPLSLILIYDFEGIINIENCTFDKTFFPSGIIYKYTGIRIIYSPLLLSYTSTNKFDQLKSIIIFNNCFLVANNYFNISIQHELLADALRNTAIVFLRDFKGSISLTNSVFQNNYFPSDGPFLVYNRKPFNILGFINISNNTFNGNSFNYFMKITDTFSRTCLVSFITDNKFLSNLLLSFLEINHIKELTVSGLFTPPFELPEREFIKAAHSNLILDHCIFLELSTAPSYVLITITSDYLVSYDTVFTLSKRKKGVFFSNETTIVTNSLFRNCNFLLFNNLRLNYLLTLANSTFDLLSLEMNGVKPFIEFVAEGLTTIFNVTFSRITTKSNLLAILYFLNTTINQLVLENIYITDGHLFRFYSITATDPSEHQLNITGVKATSIFLNLTKDNYGKFLVGVMYCHSTESGKAPAVRLSDFYLANVFYDREHMRHQILIFQYSIMTVYRVKSYNISNCMLIFFHPQTLTSEFIVEDLVFINPVEFSIVRFFDSGLGYYDKAEIRNSVFHAFNVTLNKAVGFNHAQALVLNNVSFQLLQDSGTLIFAQVNKLSKVFISDLTLRSLRGSMSTLLTIVTDYLEERVPWKDIKAIENGIVNESLSFGIRNSLFEYSYESTVMLVQAQMMFRDCIFRNIAGYEGAVVKLAQISSAILFNTTIFNANAYTMGGCFSLDSSLLIIINVSIKNSYSEFSGGCVNAVDSIIIMTRTFILNSYSVTGGTIFLDTGTIVLSHSIFQNASAEKYGAHLVAKRSGVNFSFLKFISGTAKNFGGALYLDGSEFVVEFSEFSHCFSKIGTLFAINGILNSTCLLDNVKFIHNLVEFNGAALYLSDINIEIRSLELMNNTANTGFLINVIGSFLKPVLTIEIFHAHENKITNGLFHLRYCQIKFELGIITLNKIEQGLFVQILNSIVLINRCFISQFKYSLESNQKVYLISAKLSNISINSSFFQNAGICGTLMCLDCLSISSELSSFKNGKGIMGGTFNILNGNVILNSIVITNSSSTKGGAIYAENCGIVLIKVVFSENTALNDGADLYSRNGALKLANDVSIYLSLFGNISSSAIWLDNQNLKVSRCTYFGRLNLISQAIYVFRTLLLAVEFSQFLYFFNKPVIELEKSSNNQMEIFINSSSFYYSSNPSGYGGFLKTLDQANVTIASSNFSFGSALKGGAIYYSCRNQACPFYVSNSNFISNEASLAGGAINLESFYILEKANNFLNNSAPIGSDINLIPAGLKIYKIANVSLIEKEDAESLSELIKNKSNDIAEYNGEESMRITPGHAFTLIIVIVDSRNNIKLDLHQLAIGISVVQDTKSQGHIFKPSQAEVKNGFGTFKSLILIGNTNVNITGRILFEFDNIKIDRNFSIEVNRCKRGDSYQGKRCITCLENFFSLDPEPERNNGSCLSCPENSYCPGGDSIIPRKDFWRMGTDSSVILPCKLKDACPEQKSNLMSEGNSVYQCEKGYEGNLCESCSTDYGFINNRCVPCTETKVFLVIMTVFGFLTYLLYLRFKEKKCAVKCVDNEIALIKILANHLSIFIMLAAVKVSWSSLYRDLFSMSASYINTSPSSIFSYECIVDLDKFEKVKLTMIAVGISPIVLTILMILVNLSLALLSHFKIKPLRFNENPGLFMKLHLNYFWLKSEVSKHIIIVFFNIYPQILTISFKIFGCKKLNDSSETFSLNYPWIQCQSSFYYELKLIGIILILFWGVLIPIFFFFLILRGYKTTIYRQNFRVKINFPDKKVLETPASVIEKAIKVNRYIMINLVTRGYKPNYFFWEVTVFLRKFLFLLIASYSEEMDVFSIGSLTMLFLTGFLLVSLYVMPYESENLNYFEICSLIISITTIGMGMITSLRNEIGSILSSFCLGVLLLSNFLFFSAWFVYFLRRMIQKFLKYFFSKKQSSR